jgi:hypothetical protein
MSDNESRGLLRTIKVPFDMKAVFLGALGYLVLIAGGWILDAIFKSPGDTHVVSGFITEGLSACSVSPGRIPIVGGEVSRIISTLYGRPDMTLR